MKPTPFKPIFALALALSLLDFAWAQTSSEARLKSLMEREWTRLTQDQPILGIYLGRPSEKPWPDNREPFRRETYQHYGEVLGELRALEGEGLSDDGNKNLRLLRQQLEWQRSLYEHGLDLFIMNQREGLHTTATLTDSITFQSLSDYRDWVRRLQEFGRYADREIAVLQEAVEKRRVHPKIVAERLLEQVSGQPALHQAAEKSPYYAPFLRADATLRQSPEFQKLAAEARRAIEEEVGPAFQRLSNYLSGPYLAAAPSRVGIAELPGGREAYDFLIRRYTTQDLSAEEIHRIGLREVARIRTEMEKIRVQVGFEGSLEQFFEYLRTDPSHYLQDSDELLLRYRAFCKRVDGQMPRFFKTLPRRPYGVEPIPDYIAPATTTAYYLPGAGFLAGTYCVNLYQPSTRALFEIPALSMHESVPGHHHQIALAQELDLPDFRKESAGFGDYTVFVEGWALYAESLGEEMGLYTDPYDRFGRFTYEIWRAIRLVVDTGIHTQGWTRDQAIEYFLANSPRSRLDVTNEVDRYIAWPGQALAYKMGELAITSQRRRAEQQLGERFDLAEFHDAVLLQGAVPVDELSRQIDNYIERVNQRPRN